MIYLDTSALVKLVVDEEGGDVALATYSEADAVGTVSIAYVEVKAAVARARRTGRIDGRKLAVALASIDTLWADLTILNVDEKVIRSAAAIAVDRGLRGYDAVHLAAALDFAEGEPVRFLCWDVELARAAEASGLEVLP